MTVVWFYIRIFEITSNHLQTGVIPFKLSLDAVLESIPALTLYSDQQELCVDENILKALHNMKETK